ncbi:hypothetical protein QYE76_058654 [Lolium multiflorum]|uniref:Uncharacterized protein n=1 Tax=Lolium multiflorum TaxID=4521 RepID=A0AAD8WSM4_LOLMU|nr:hypothetical protein QYE76_058654 [Lolium multiflorum]
MKKKEVKNRQQMILLMMIFVGPFLMQEETVDLHVASMVLSMSSARISRYKIDAKEDMIRNNRRQIRCPCRSCKLERWINPDSGQLEEHLLRRGFMQDNQARPAPSNGAHEDHVERDDYHHEEDYHHADGDYHHEEEVGGEDHHEEEDAGGEDHHDEEEDSGATPLISALRDSHVQDLLLQETSNDRVAARERAKLSQMEKDGMTPIFPGCRPQDTRLHVTLDYLQMKTQNKWTDSSFSKNLKFWHDRLPEGNTLPSSIEEAKKVVCPLDLPHEKYHACINDCVIYRCEYKDRTTCPVCGHGRYKVGNKKVPRKVVWYFPITPRLQRYFVDPKEAKLMQWHAERQKPEEDPEMGYMLTHPSDAGQWQALDIAFPRFGGDARNIRLGMSTDGLNPFGNQSSTHSTWPVFVWPYNLPPWLCTKQRYIHLSILIQGPKQPGVDMHLYLGLLKEELDTLWKTPPRTWDAYTRTYFDMRAALITTVTDYPGYAYVSAQVGHGFNGCVKCMDETPHLQLPRDPGSSKTVYPGARRWLRLDHPWRKRGDLFNGKDEPDGPPRPRSGAEIDDLLKNWKECPAPGKKRPKPEPLLGVWKARSVFHDLEYWKVLHTPHSLDVMHITKNVTESLLGTLCNSEKSKDGPKARYDLKHFGIRKDLQAPDTDDDDDDDDDQTEGTQRLRKRAKKNAVQLPAACFTTSPEELEQFFRCLLGVKVPHGYSGNISRYLDVAKKRFTGMKSHDCHVLMTQILPVAIRGIMDEHVRDTLFGLCNFFDVITRKSIGVRQLKMLQDEIVVILCELEIYFPPAFCDICVHLLLHVVEDIKQLGPTFLHNMMPFERQNGVMKGYVRNRARPDASMAKGFLTYECISFCQNYLSTEDDEDHVGLPPRTHLGRLAGVGHREGYRSVHVGIDNRRDDFDRAHRVALQHLKLIEPFVQEHKSMVEQNYIDMGRPRKMGDVTKKHNSSFTRWFKQTQLVEAQRKRPSTEDEKLIYTLSQGPGHNVRTYQGYDINGYRFYTEEKDRNSENQNSGVTMLSYADDETNVKERFFGRIEEIWELNYCGETVPMFRVRWAKKVEKEGRYFTTMVIPDAKSKNASAKNEPWVLGSQVDQCFFITDPSRPSRVVVRRGKRSIIGMQGDANEEDLDKNGDPKIEEEFDRHFDMPTTSKHSINYLESVLLKEKDPNYPVFSVKVPSDQNFVNEDPADIFFIAFEDVFNLFHSKRLDYNLLQDGSRTRTKAVRYLQNFMLMYKESNTILLPVFPEDKYCTLIILDPKWSLAQYFDSSSTTTKKDYKRIRGVLDEAILGYSKNGGTFDKNGQYIRPDTKKLGFKHVIDFPCIKQPAGSIKEAFYVLHHLKGFVEDAEMMSLPPKMTYYVVFEGRVPGVYEEWEECKKQVHKFSGNCYKGYPTRHEAVAKWRAHQANKSKMKTFLVLSLLLTIVAAVLYFILV